MRGTVLVVGDVITDIVVLPEGPLVPGADRRATIRALPGGSGANQAAWLVDCGAKARFAGRVGAADHARQAKLFRDAGVEPCLAADPDLPTGTIVTLLAPDGERSFFTNRGANDRLSRADLPGSLLGGVDLLHVSGYSLFSPGPRAAVLEFLAEANARGVPVSVDAGSHSFLAEAGPAEFFRWTHSARILFANAAEAAVLAGTEEPDRQLDILAREYSMVVIKRGAEGAAAASEGRRCMAAAPEVVSIDSTGAGDAFVAAFLVGYLQGAGLETSLDRAVAAGSGAVTRLGGRPS